MCAALVGTKMLWLGYLHQQDPLNGWLRQEIFPQLGLSASNSTIDVFRVTASNRVYIYKTVQNDSVFQVVGKFFGKTTDSNAKKRFLLQRELNNIQRLQKLGLDVGTHRIVHCLGSSQALDNVLITEYVEGSWLSRYIKAAVFTEETESLYTALSHLAYFLQLLHQRSRTPKLKVDFNKEYAYFSTSLERLKPLISHDAVDHLFHLASSWKNDPKMWAVSSVQVHGDCTPTNFIVSSSDPKLVALDLERSKQSDPVFDTGRVAGELKHHFLMFTGDGWKAEPFIHHFYKAYCSHFENSNALFSEITHRNPFYQAVTELRIAKNYWISSTHRERLVDEAKKCLKHY